MRLYAEHAVPASRAVDVLSMVKDVCKARLGRVLAQLPDQGLRLRPWDASEKSLGYKEIAGLY